MTENTIALVTGANKGIGLEIARGLGADARGRGAAVTVLVGARDAERGEAAAELLRGEGIDAHAVRIDVTDEESVLAAAKEIEAAHGRLDILVNNAGIAATTADQGVSPSTVTLAAIREIYETNVFGVIAVTNAMLPLLRRSAHGRIVNMSSGLGSLTQMSDPASDYYAYNLLPYNSSKTALNAVTLCYAKELADTGIKVNLADPGYCATDLNYHQGVRTPAQGAVIAVRLATLGDAGPTGGYYDENGELSW